MVGYIMISSGTAQWLSEKWRHYACTSVVITFCTSPFCVGVTVLKKVCKRQLCTAGINTEAYGATVQW